MNIWVLKHGEQLPLTKKSRVYRMGMIAKVCTEQRNEVTWWTSEYNHAMKAAEDVDNIDNRSINFKFLKGIPYSKNISIQRVINHHQIGTKLQKKMNHIEKKPDIIITSMPTIDFAYRAVKFAKKNDIPVIVDVRDLWPDVFKDLIPLTFLKKNFLFKPFNKKLKWLLQNATSITAITEEYLEWALKKAELEFNSDKHLVFPIGYPEVEIKKISNPFDENYLNIVFAGTIGVHFDLITILEVAKMTENENIRYYFIGDGDRKELLEKKYQSSNIVFTGWLNGETLNRYLNHASIGIAPYKNSKNFLMNIPNKFYEYMAYGLPTLTCLPGPSAELVTHNKTGLFYNEGNKSELYNCIMRLKKDEELYSEISSNAKTTFSNNFSTNIIYKKYYNMIENTIKMYK